MADNTNTNTEKPGDKAIRLLKEICYCNMFKEELPKDYKNIVTQEIVDFLNELEECDMCTETGGFYLGTTCPKCLKPFRSVKYIIEE